MSEWLDVFYFFHNSTVGDTFLFSCISCYLSYSASGWPSSSQLNAILAASEDSGPFQFPRSIKTKVRCQPEVPNSNVIEDPAAGCLKMWSSLCKTTEHIGTMWLTWEHTDSSSVCAGHQNICRTAYLQPWTVTDMFCLSYSSIMLQSRDFYGPLQLLHARVVPHCLHLHLHPFSYSTPWVMLCQCLALASICIFYIQIRDPQNCLVSDPHLNSVHRIEGESMRQTLTFWLAVWYSGFV